MVRDTVGIAGIGTYFPSNIETAAEIAEGSGIPEAVVIEKLGLVQRHRAPQTLSVTDMATFAAQRALAQAAVNGAEVNLVVYHGSEYKEHLIWNSAGKIQNNIGAVNAYGFEIHAVCAAAPIAIHTVNNLMQGDPRIKNAVLTVGTKEHDLINYGNMRSRFMFNFSAGAGAMVLQRGLDKNVILGASAFTDGTLADTVVLSTQNDVVGHGPEGQGDLRGRLDVYNLAYMGERLGAVSLPNFIRVIREAVEQSNARVKDIAFLGVTHTKRSFFRELLAGLGLSEDQSVYLENYGHVQSADQVIALELGLQQGKIKPGDLVVLAGAGAGYTWSATAIRWG